VELINVWRAYGKSIIVIFFFFQAEDGIRDKLVTGVQTCALPICDDVPLRGRRPRSRGTSSRRAASAVAGAGKHDAAWAVPESGGPAVYAIASPATFRHKASRRCLFCITGGTHGCGELLSVPERARSALEVQEAT